MEKNDLYDPRLWITGIVSTFGGMMIAWIDSQPTWDDTGITAAMLFLVSGLAGFITPRRLWLWGLLVGIWIPVVAITRRGDAMMLIVMIISFGGSFFGGVIRKMIINR